MPTFDTPEPISVIIDLELGIGDVRIAATDRTDTVVNVRARNTSSKSDLKAAEQTRIDYAAGQLVVETTQQHRQLFSRGGSVDVRLELPAGSRVRADTAQGGLRSTGRLGECRFKTYRGDVVIERADGFVEATTASGRVDIGQADGDVVIRNEHGDCRIGAITGSLRLAGMKGDVQVDKADGDVEVKITHGNIRLEDVARGSVVATTVAGTLEIGVREGSAAWLDVRSELGDLQNSLTGAAGPEPTDETVEVRARTYGGDIVVRRAG
jgi:DUF4097 and DUF4098 domain-containing protein YvlB